MKYLKNIAKLFRFSKRISRLDRKIQDLFEDQYDNDRILQARLKNLENLRKQVAKEVEYANQTLERAEHLNKKLLEALDAARGEVDTLKEITVPGLIEANNVLINRWRNESQIHAINAAMKKVD